MTKNGGTAANDSHLGLPMLPLDSSSPFPVAWLQRASIYQAKSGAPRESNEAARRKNVEHRPASPPTRPLWCSCSECGAPLSVRIWLQVADCWNCGATLRLDRWEEEPARLVTPIPPAPREDHVDLPVHEPLPSVQPPPVPRRIAPPPLPDSSLASDWSWSQATMAALVDLPAWLISLLFHLLLLLLLGLCMFPTRIPSHSIVLSTTISPWMRRGESLHLQSPSEPLDDDLPASPLPDHFDRVKRESLLQADQEARALREDPRAQPPELPSRAELQKSLDRDVPQRMFVTRDPRLRAALVEREGGTSWTEASVARGLRWLAQHQQPDGRWSLHAFADGDRCGGRCGGAGMVNSDSAATSLALLPFLGAGQTHQWGIYRSEVTRGLRWLIQRQAPNGDLRIGTDGSAGMYAHGQGAIVLCEAYALTRDPQLRGPAQRAIDFIVDAQHEEGGWRYSPGEPGDTSVFGWQLMAMQSARAAGLHVPTVTWESAELYLDQVGDRKQIRYRYQPGHGTTEVMTAEALLCRLYLGWHPHDPRVVAGSRWLVEDHPPDVNDPNVYYWYYATQLLHHCGGPAWDQWNLLMRDALVQRQVDHGHEAGSWDPEGPHTAEGGRLYATSLAICTLEVYYRHAPIFRRLVSATPSAARHE